MFGSQFRTLEPAIFNRGVRHTRRNSAGVLALIGILSQGWAIACVPAGGGGSGSGGTGGTGGAGGSPSVPTYMLVVDTPAQGASVQGVVSVSGHAPGFLNVEVWDETRDSPVLARATPNSAGDFTTSVDVSSFASGPASWMIRAWDSPAGEAFTHTAEFSLDLTIANPGGSAGASPGWNLVAIDTSRRTYLDYVNVPASGVWKPENDHFPVLATWENQSSYSALRFQPFKPGDVLTPARIMALLPATRRASRSLSITDAPYGAAPSPSDATQAIQRALNDAAAMARPGSPVDVLVPAGTFNYSAALTVAADVRLRRFPEDTGGTLHATNPGNEAIHLAGDRSGALFLVLTSSATARDATAQSSGIWVGSDNGSAPFVHDALVVGNDVAQPASAHVFGFAEDGGLWAFNYAHDGYADTFHHTGGSRYCQVVGNRAQTRANRGDDHYAFVSYQADGDIVHHCACIANWGRDGAARGLSVVGGGFILLDHNDIDRTQWAGVYLAQENSFQTYGVFDITVSRNSIAYANLGGSHDGLLAYSDAPSQSHNSVSFGSVPNQLSRIFVRDNTFSDTAAPLGNGFGIEIRSSVDTGEVTGNTLTGNQPPQLVVNGTHFTLSGNQVN